MTDRALGASRSSFLQALRSPSRPLLWDGGIGTALIASGLELRHEPPEAWLWSHKDELLAIHRGFVAAQVDVLQTCTFGLVRLLATGGLPPEPGTGRVLGIRDYVQQAVASASLPLENQRPMWLVGSLGPTGDAGLSQERLAGHYREVVEAFAEAQVAALHLETCFDPRELRLALRAVRAATPELPVLVSLTVTHGQQGLETPLGVPLQRMLRELSDDPPALVGVNCSQNAERMRGAVAMLAEWAQAEGRRIPVLARPQLHNGTPDCKRPPKEISPQRFAEQLLLLIDEGATAIGGCCGVTAAHLAAARQAIEGFLSPVSKL
jgi:5-methyltetrahydrofolate--homocysteine methyltransferase